MLDHRKALWDASTEGMKSGVCKPGDRVRIMVAIARPRIRQQIFDMIDTQCLSAGLITNDGDLVEGEGFQSTWLLIIELLIQFLPVILEFLKKRNS